ncbi:MAG TPA: hypothetical protein VNA25_08205 [Phycisphaerae bacterium]|nr:hypothetical protein [Phycisphaerae bacterium]
MSNCMFSYPNFLDGATLSNGSYVATLPLNNLKTRYLDQVARSTDATVGSTKFDADLLTGYPIRVVAVLKHSMTLAALIRVRVSTVSNFATTTYDSGWLTAYPLIYPDGVLLFGAPGFWDGKLAETDRLAGYRQDYILVVPADTLGRYVRVEIDDTTNAAGYVDMGRAWVGSGYPPTVNFSTGLTLGWMTGTVVSEMPGGRRFFLTRPERRALNFRLEVVPADEALVYLFEITRRHGLDEQFFFLYNPADTYHLHRRSFPATLRELSALEEPYWAWMGQAYSLTEDF